VELLESHPAQCPPDIQEIGVQPSFDLSYWNVERGELNLDDPTLQAAQVLADGMVGRNCNMGDHDAMLSLDPSQSLRMQSLANLLDSSFFWEMAPAGADANIGT
jgi:hypothetical protein